MRIGEVAARAGCSTRSVRYYEQHGLLESDRLANGYRDYAEQAVRRVINIRRLLDLGLVLDDVRYFVPCLDGDPLRSAPQEPGLDIVRRRLTELTGRIDTLTEIRDGLAAQLAEAQREPRTVGTGAVGASDSDGTVPVAVPSATA
ncbi:MerR family transcriptional regulator [Actinoalloteichus hymeniacidonis]|uniref:Transcriptional regulator n=1 Tax=Actinoalloteichus hymeniacidonis TaxID=340345 RepID=A0AAC9MXT3_9PSEU|nr:MerR family transcriptional regulator [Actinoalloteichus hymeniacidonis]AOS62625.1 putative transcriptional regulator [Actinoalloteichus hymeniacidonis]MBB5909343.1 DNA-binding transcriptional MerR regulator [Actinoalloteichus hymeniacidonis]